LVRIKCWGDFSINDQQVLPDGIHVIIMLIHIVNTLNAYLAITGWRLPIDTTIPYQKPQAPKNLINIGVRSSLWGSICMRMSIPLIIFKILFCQDECCILAYPRIIYPLRWPWTTIMILLIQGSMCKTYRATWNWSSRIAMPCTRSSLQPL
jgi:hypothetical protein